MYALFWRPPSSVLPAPRLGGRSGRSLAGASPEPAAPSPTRHPMRSVLSCSRSSRSGSRPGPRQRPTRPRRTSRGSRWRPSSPLGGRDLEAWEPARRRSADSGISRPPRSSTSRPWAQPRVPRVRRLRRIGAESERRYGRPGTRERRQAARNLDRSRVRSRGSLRSGEHLRHEQCRSREPLSDRPEAGRRRCDDRREQRRELSQSTRFRRRTDLDREFREWSWCRGIDRDSGGFDPLDGHHGHERLLRAPGRALRWRQRLGDGCRFRDVDEAQLERGRAPNGHRREWPGVPDLRRNKHLGPQSRLELSLGRARFVGCRSGDADRQRAEPSITGGLRRRARSRNQLQWRFGLAVEGRRPDGDRQLHQWARASSASAATESTSGSRWEATTSPGSDGTRCRRQFLGLRGSGS